MKAFFKKNVLYAFKKIMKKLGFEVFPYLPGYHYVPKYYGKSASKQPDIQKMPIFGELADKVIQDRHTYLYYDRLFTIYQIMVNVKSLFKNNSSVNTAELGVYRGGGSYFISSLAIKLDFSIRHHCFDTFEGHVAEDVIETLEPGQTPGSFNSTSFAAAKEYLQEFSNLSIYKGRFQDTCHNLDDMEFGFVHLDMDIYSPTIFALNYFEEKIVKGGVILLDDYGFSSCPGIEKAAMEFISKAGSKYFGMPLLNGQFVLIKL